MRLQSQGEDEFIAQGYGKVPDVKAAEGAQLDASLAPCCTYISDIFTEYSVLQWVGARDSNI